MESLTPPVLTAIQEVSWRLSCGQSVRDSFRLYLQNTNDGFSHALKEWWILKSKNQERQFDRRRLTSHYQISFLNLLERGLQGQPTLEQFRILESEVETAAHLELEAHLAGVPFKVILPLLFFQFPAYLLVLLGPLLRDLNQQLSGS